MKLLFADWKAFCRQDVLDAFTALGHEYTLYPLSEQAQKLGIDTEEVDRIKQAIEDADCQFVFSMNYFPMVSDACMRTGIPYLSWIYDNPYMKAYAVNIINDCNFIFTFDSAMYDKLAAQGVTTVFYAPMAANPDRLTSYTDIPAHYQQDISFVGALYNEDHNFYDEFVEKANKNGKQRWVGYTDALIQIQMLLYGTNILTQAIKPEIAACGYTSMNPWTEINAYFTTPEDLFCDNVLCRQVTAIERRSLLEKMSENHEVALYTRNPKAVVGKCDNRGYVDYKTEMPQVFRGSKINLNISLRSIQNGIPLRAMEIMGAGGFLLTNFQSDFLLHFEPDVDFVYYENMTDALEKADYYLKHKDEREKIAENGLAKIREYHTYEKRLTEMLALLGEA